MVGMLGLVPGEDSGGPFDLVNGLPVHPLVVHAAVVLIPLTALGLLVMVVSPRFSRALGWLVALGGLVAAGSAFVAKESGEALEERVGEPGFDHADLGELMPVFAAVLFVMAVVLWLLDRSAPPDGPSPRRGLRIAVAAVAAMVAVGNLVWVYRVGDSGAKSVWSGRVAASVTSGTGGEDSEESAATTDDTDDTDDDATTTATPEASATGLTMAQVATRDSASDCWVAIGGSVYDLTAWIDQHPGGAQRIIDLCGTDGTAAFQGQHSGDDEPAQELSNFVVGTLQ